MTSRAVKTLRSSLSSSSTDSSGNRTAIAVIDFENLLSCRVQKSRARGVQRYTRWIPFASKCRAVPWDAHRKNHTWGIRHLAGPIRDVGFAGRGESVAGARCRCGFVETWQLAVLECSSVISLSVVIAFKWRGLAPRRHRLLRIVVRVAWPWCVVRRDAEP